MLGLRRAFFIAVMCIPVFCTPLIFCNEHIVYAQLLRLIPQRQVREAMASEMIVNTKANSFISLHSGNANVRIPRITNPITMK